jgi:hypothetical protein
MEKFQIDRAKKVELEVTAAFRVEYGPPQPDRLNGI